MEALYKTKYEELLKEHNKLKHEYSENVIIQSMNSMKDVYNEKVYEYDLLNERHTELNERYKSLNERYIQIKNLYNDTKKLYNELEKSEDYLSKRKLLLEDNIRAVIIMVFTLKDIRISEDFKSKLQFIEDILYNALYH